MSELEPITREERLLNSISDGVDSGLEPLTREEHYLSAIAGESDLPADITPLTRREKYLQKIYDNGGAGGGGEAEGTVEINITQNGTITRNVARYASAEITTNVPNPSTGTKNITQNGDHDVTDYATAHVDVPNSYASSDEGKVVSNGALVAQTSKTVTQNGTVDTTLNNEVVVNVPSSGITPSGSQTFTENGTYDVTNLAEAVVNVESSGGIHTFSGEIELVDTNVQTLNIPVSIPTENYRIYLYAYETGDVSDGVVTKHDHVTVPNAFSSNNWVYYFVTYNPAFPSITTYRNETQLNTTDHVSKVMYLRTRYGMNGSQDGGTYTLGDDSITLNTNNSSKLFCMAGAYVKFKYEITYW